MNGGPATFDYRRVCKITKWPQSVGPKTFELNPCSYYSTGRFTKEKVLSKKSNLLRILMDFVGCFSSFEGNQWLNSSKFWNKCVRYSVEVCHRLRLSTITLPFSLVWALCSGYPATHVGPDKTDWYTFRNIPTSNVPVGINWCQQFPSKVQSGKCITWIRHTSHSPNNQIFLQVDSVWWGPTTVSQNVVWRLVTTAEIFFEVPGYHRAMNIMIIMWPQRRSDSSLLPSAPAVPGLRVRQPQNLWFPHSMQVSLSLTPSPFYASVIKCDS